MIILDSVKSGKSNKGSKGKIKANPVRPLLRAQAAFLILDPKGFTRALPKRKR